MADEPAEEAVREAAELILADEALVSDLEDVAADVLLHWALAAARQATLERTEGRLPPERQAIAEAVHPVRRIVRAANDLTAARCDLDEAEFLHRLLALIELARKLPSGSVAQGEAEEESLSAGDLAS